MYIHEQMHPLLIKRYFFNVRTHRALEHIKSSKMHGFKRRLKILRPHLSNSFLDINNRDDWVKHMAQAIPQGCLWLM